MFLDSYLKSFEYKINDNSLFPEIKTTTVDKLSINGINYNKYVNEFWTAKQRQANSIHEISYRACFKPQLPRFFIDVFTKMHDTVYDPFNGRGTTVIEAAIANRQIIANDINPLSIILTKPRLSIPSITEIEERLNNINVNYSLKSNIDLSMFYEKKTLSEILSIKEYLVDRAETHREDNIDEWIRMIATNRLTGHSTNFFSVYTLPPNQAISPDKQKKINISRKQKPEYKDTKKIIIKKSKDLLKDITETLKQQLAKINESAIYLNNDARFTPEIKDNTIQLTVTSPPFLDVVQYANDNWLRCWFNNIDIDIVEKKITMSRRIEDWCNVMQAVLMELYRITKLNGWVAFEVGEVRNGKIKLDEYIVPLGIKAGFSCEAILINEQKFTKTANIWGVKNNSKGTNSNRIILFNKRK